MATLRLSNYMRDAFVRRVMDDVPRVLTDDTRTEQIQALVLADALHQAPDWVRECWADPSRRGWLGVKAFTYSEGHGNSVTTLIPCVTDPEFEHAWKVERIFKMSPQIIIKVQRISAAYSAEIANRVGLQNKVTSIAKACTTRSSLAKMLPEFEKYLPAETDDGGRSLPVIQNVVADFIKAGWPKKEEKK